MIKNLKLKINNSPKIALVHDYLKEYGGAEAVLETLSDIFPDAPIYTSLYAPQFFGPHRQRLEKKWSHRIHQSFFHFLPFSHKLISPLRLISPIAFKSFDFSLYDIIVSSATGAYFPNSLNKKNAQLICYCHTPPRYLYGLPTARDLKKYPLFNLLAQFANHFLRLLDFHWSQNVDQYVANSATTAARIKKFYRRDALIINPPVDIPKNLKPKSNIFGAQSSEVNAEGREHRKILHKSYFLTGGRLARAKRYDIAILACNQLKVPLKIFGRDFANYQSELQSIAGPTIEFVGEVNQSQKSKLYQQASAFIFCSDNEDFGIVPVEAMAYGCPVVGYKSGGVTETVIDGQTGVLFDQLTATSCANAISKLEKTNIKSADCLSQAQNFSQAKFIEKINSLINP